MSILIKSPYPIYTDIDGDPLEAGYIYIGQPGLNPLSSPLQAYWDAALTVPATNIRTKGGYPSNNGKPGQLYVSSDYSFLLQDKKQAHILLTLNSRDTPLIYETELQTYNDNDIIQPSLVHLDAVLNTSLGDALFTLNAGLFEGQQVHLIADGTGVAQLTGGNGIYTNSIYITENTGGAHLKWTNSQWVAVNEVTADYTVGAQQIYLKPLGHGEIIHEGIALTTSVLQSNPIYGSADQSITPSITLSAQKINHSAISTSGGVWSVSRPSNNYRLFGLSNSDTGQLYVTFKGRY